MRPIILLASLFMLAGRVAAESRWTHPDACDLMAGEALDLASDEFTELMLAPHDRTFVLAELREGTMGRKGTDGIYDVFGGAAHTIKVLQGSFSEKDWRYECRTLHSGSFTHHSYVPPCFICAGAGTALVEIAPPNGADATIRVATALLVPRDWCDSITRFWGQSRNPKLPPFCEVDEASLSEWRKQAESNDAVTSLLAFQKVCRSALADRPSLIQVNVANARAVRQAALMIAVLRGARDEDVPKIANAVTTVILNARSAAEISGLATGLALAGARGAQGEIDQILLGFATDLKQIRALSAGDRISRYFLEMIRDRSGTVPGLARDDVVRRARLRVGLRLPNEPTTNDGELIWAADPKEQRAAEAERGLHPPGRPGANEN
jgi:hypothetical protein